MKRTRSRLIVSHLVAAVTVAAFLFVDVQAGAQNPIPTGRVDPPHLERLFMRHTVAAASQPNWNLPLYNTAFTDSAVFRNTAGAVLSNNDTTVAISISNLQMADPVNNALAVSDSLAAPWCVLFVRANTSAVPVFSGTTALDSVYVSAEWSHDGATWNAADGTPTKAFFAANVSPTTLISLLGIEQTNLAPIAIPITCAAGFMPVTDTFVINRNLCMSGGFLRFIINTGAGTGQYSADLLHW